MAITQTITALPEAPNWQSDLPEDAEQKALNFTRALPQMGEELNEVIAEINAAGEVIAEKEASAVSAANSAISAKTAAETAKTDAQNARSDAISANTEAQTAKADAQTARNQAQGFAAQANPSPITPIEFAPFFNFKVSEINGQYGIKRLRYFGDALLCLGGTAGAQATYDGANAIGGFTDRPAYDCLEYIDTDGQPAVLVTTGAKILKYSRDLITWSEITINDPDSLIGVHVRHIAGVSVDRTILLGTNTNPYKLFLYNLDTNVLTATAANGAEGRFIGFSRPLNRFYTRFGNDLYYGSSSNQWTQIMGVNASSALFLIAVNNIVAFKTTSAVYFSKDFGSTFTSVSIGNVYDFDPPKYIPELNKIFFFTQTKTICLSEAGDIVLFADNTNIVHGDYCKRRGGFIFSKTSDSGLFFSYA